MANDNRQRTPDPIELLTGTPSPGHLAIRHNGHVSREVGDASPRTGQAERPAPSFRLIEHPRGVGAPLIRSAELSRGDSVVARATWSNTLDAEGHVMVLHIEVSPRHRREGLGLAIFRELKQAAAADLARDGHRLRRITCEVRQKAHVVARAFLTRLGFHHVTTVKHVFRDEDLLVYLLGCD